MSEILQIDAHSALVRGSAPTVHIVTVAAGRARETKKYAQLLDTPTQVSPRFSA
jgi:hypothetical protein